MLRWIVAVAWALEDYGLLDAALESEAAHDEAVRLGLLTQVNVQNWFWDMGEVTGVMHVNGVAKPYRDATVVLENPAKWPVQLKQCRVKGVSREVSIEKFLGKGAGGRVFRARDDQGAVAVKFVQEVTNDFRTEFALLQKIASSGVERLNGLAPDFAAVQSCCGIPCMVVDLIEGQTLSEVMAERGINYKNQYVSEALKRREPAALAKITPLDPATLQDYALQGLVAFAELERLGLCNSDQNLRNVMVDQSGKVIFIDFGFARREATCAPTNFRPENLSPHSTPQQWPTLQYLLADAGEQQRYARFCARVAGARSAAQALAQEAGLDGEAPYLRLTEDQRAIAQAALDKLPAPAHARREPRRHPEGPTPATGLGPKPATGLGPKPQLVAEPAKPAAKPATRREAPRSQCPPNMLDRGRGCVCAAGFVPAPTGHHAGCVPGRQNAFGAPTFHTVYPQGAHGMPGFGGFVGQPRGGFGHVTRHVLH